MKIAAMQGVDFTTPQTRVHCQQIKQLARCGQQPLGLIVIQSPPLDALFAARIHFANDFKRIGRNPVLFAQPSEQGRQNGVILIDGFRSLCLFGAPAQERIRRGVAQKLPVTFPHEPPQPLVHMTDVIYGTSQRLQISNVTAHQFRQRTFKCFALRRRCQQTHRLPFLVADVFPHFLLGYLPVGNAKGNVPRLNVAVQFEPRPPNPARNQFAVALPFGTVNVSNHIISFRLTWLTQLLKIRFDLAFEHSHGTANVPQRWQFAVFRPPSHRPLADTENLFQFREPDQTVIE